MKRLLAFVALLASGVVPGAFVQAQAAPASVPAGPAKIAVIAFQVAVAQTNEGQRNFADLQKKFEPRRQQLKTLSDQIDTLTKQLQSQAGTLSDTEKANRARDIDAKRKELDRSTQDAQSDYQQAIQDMYTSLAGKVYDVLDGYVKQHGYTLVLDISEQQSPVLYATANVNITKEIIDAYNQKSGVPAPPPAAPQPAAPAAH
jgi:outer membrane protein